MTYCPRNPYVIGVCIPEEILGIPACNYRNLKGAGGFNKFLICFAKPYPLSCQDNRSPGILQFLKDLIRIGFIKYRLFDAFCVLTFESGEMVSVYKRSLYVKGHIYPDRSSSAVSSKIPCLFKLVPDLIRVCDHNRKLGDRLYNTYNVAFLISELPQATSCVSYSRRSFNLTGYHKHRNRIHPAVKDSRYGVSASGSACHTYSSHLSRETGISLCGNG